MVNFTIVCQKNNNLNFKYKIFRIFTKYLFGDNIMYNAYIDICTNFNLSESYIIVKITSGK